MSEVGLFQASKASESRSVSRAFEQFLDKEINISRGTRGLASTSQNHLREFLVGERERDSSFPRVLSIADSDFLGGSFARHTKIWPLDDIDVYLPLDGQNLIYVQGGMTLPYAVLSDGCLIENPLLNYRWMNGQYLSSAKLAAGFAAVLRRHYPDETLVFPNAEAVSIRMKQGASGSGDGLGYDVVPCFSLKPTDSTETPFYLIPNGSDGWIRTNPRVDKTIADYLQANNDKAFRKVVKLIKYWNFVALDGGLSSYYIELAIARGFLSANSNSQRVSPVPFAVYHGFSSLQDALQNGNQQSWINGGPPVEPGNNSRTTLLSVALAVMEANSACTLEQAGRHDEAIDVWGQIFGSSFANR